MLNRPVVEPQEKGALEKQQTIMVANLTGIRHMKAVTIAFI
jgi:hypothetical protein